MISGSSVPFYAGRKMCLLAPVSISEWETYELLKLKDTLFYLLYCSMHRADHSLSKRNVRRFIWRHKKYIICMINVICQISLPAEKDKDNKKIEDTKDTVDNVKTMFRVFSDKYGWPPFQIANMSPLQLYNYMTGGTDGTGVVRMSPQQYRQFKMENDNG